MASQTSPASALFRNLKPHQKSLDYADTNCINSMYPALTAAVAFYVEAEILQEAVGYKAITQPRRLPTRDQHIILRSYLVQWSAISSRVCPKARVRTCE